AVMQVAESYSTVKRRLLAMRETRITSRFRLAAAATFVTVAAIAALVPWRVVAQESSKIHAGAPFTFQMAASTLGKLADALNLTSVQQTKIRAIHESAINQVRRTLTPQQLQRLDQLAANSHDPMAALALTPDQEKRFVLLKQQMGE